ncbi:hypothetical protein HY991_03675 [Candidatus Micrarchaeota archaeon]|nr:hypothetical protein [Candidatus Micrarchaeota archaeon]
MKKMLFLLLAALALGAVWFTYFGGREQVFGPESERIIGEKLVSFEKKYQENLITYYDSEYGFSVRYPIGYMVFAYPIFGVHVRFQADFRGFSSEVIDVRVINSTDQAKNAFRENLKEFAGKELLEQKETTVNGRNAFILKAKKALEEGEDVFYFTEAFYECVLPNKEGYSLSLVAAIPEGLLADQQLIDYMVYSLKC